MTVISFRHHFHLITLAWLTIIISTGYCKTDNTSTLNCTITSEQNINGTNRTISRKIPAVNKCARGYENEDITSKCEDLISRQRAFDLDLFSPVTNSLTNVTYLNKFCAICNNDNETNWQLWLTWSYNQLTESRCEYSEPIIQRSEVDDLYILTQKLITEAGMKLATYYYGGRELECSIGGNWPIHLLYHILPCLIDKFRYGQITRLEPCQYVEKTGKICTKMRFFMDGFTFSYQKGDKINYVNKLSSLNFTRGEYIVESGYDNVFYICEQPDAIYKMGHWFKISISFISLIFIIIYLGVNLNKRYFQNIENKMLYSYMVGLILMYAILLLIYFSYPVPCVAFYLAQFSWFFHFFWTMLIFIEFCSLAYCTCRKCNARDDSLQHKRYIFYCILGFVVPLVMPIMYHYGVLVINENYKENIFTLYYSRSQITQSEYTCPLVPDHLAVSCVAYQNSGAEYYSKKLVNILDSSFYFFMPALFVSELLLALNYCPECDPFSRRSIPRSDHLIISTKMTLIMGIHWVLYKIYQNYGKDHSFTILGLSMDTICQLSIDFHGVIVFVVFGIGSCMKKCGYKFKTISQQNDNSDTEVTQQAAYPLSAQSNQT